MWNSWIAIRCPGCRDKIRVNEETGDLFCGECGMKVTVKYIHHDNPLHLYVEVDEIEEDKANV